MPTTYNLGTIQTRAGLVEVIAYGKAGLSTPSKLILTSIGKKKEKCDGPAYGIVTIESINLTFKDRGDFWKSILVEDTFVRLNLNSSFFFYGCVNKRPTWSEYHIDPGTNTTYRYCTITVTSSISKLKDVSVDTVLSNLSVTSWYGQAMIPFAELCFRCMVSALPDGQSIANDLIIPNEDYRYQKQDDSYIGFADLHAFAGSISGGVTTWAGYFDQNDPEYLGKQYKSALELLRGVANNFGFIPRIKFNSSTNKHQLYLLTKQRRSPSYVTPGRVASSERFYTDAIPASFRVTRKDGHTTDQAFCTDVTLSQYYFGTAPEFSYELDEQLRWFTPWVDSDNNFRSLWYLIVPGSQSIDVVKSVVAWDYWNGVWDSGFIGGQPTQSVVAKARLFQGIFKAFGSYPPKLGFRRSFEGLMDGLAITDCMQVQDGATTIDCFVNDVEVDPTLNQTNVELVEMQSA